jgi:tetratricopeptide (TPR) repeat protein
MLDSKNYKPMDDHIKLKIESFISNSMSEEEMLLFEKQLENDAELKKEVELAKEMNLFLKGDLINKQSNPPLEKELYTFLKSDEATTLKNKLLNVKNDYKNNSLKPKKKNYFLAAVSIAILVMGTLGYLLLNQHNPEKLYQRYYSSNDLPSVIKRDNTQNELIQPHLQFKEEKYKTAITYFERYKVNTHKINEAVFIYEGVAHMKLNNYEKARLEFDNMIQSNSIDSSKGLWFKALLYLKKQDKTKAKIILEKIVADPENFKFKKAKKLLKDL